MTAVHISVEVNKFYARLCRAILIGMLLLISGCESSKIITEAIVASCGTSTVYLSGWFSRLTDSSVDYDPMGGYVFAYWIDDANNVCHGNPGVNGQPGKAVIKAFKLKAHELAIQNSFVTLDQLKDFQDIPVSFDNYVGSGIHFIQYFNNLARVRNGGQGIRFSGLDGGFSIPEVIDIGTMSCMAPIVMRSTGPYSALPLPNLLDPNWNTQDPDKCKVRAFPGQVAMSEEDRKKYDPENFLHGSELFDVP